MSVKKFDDTLAGVEDGYDYLDGFDYETTRPMMLEAYQMGVTTIQEGGQLFNSRYFKAEYGQRWLTIWSAYRRGAWAERRRQIAEKYRQPCAALV